MSLESCAAEQILEGGRAHCMLRCLWHSKLLEVLSIGVIQLSWKEPDDVTLILIDTRRDT